MCPEDARSDRLSSEFKGDAIEVKALISRRKCLAKIPVVSPSALFVLNRTLVEDDCPFIGFPIFKVPPSGSIPVNVTTRSACTAAANKSPEKTDVRINFIRHQIADAVPDIRELFCLHQPRPSRLRIKIIAIDELAPETIRTLLAGTSSSSVYRQGSSFFEAAFALPRSAG